MLAVAALGVTGALAQRVAAPVWTAMQAREPARRPESATAAAGRGVTLALLGGFRSLVADALWIELHLVWEKRNLPAADTLVRLVPAIDPRPTYFWLNGARIMAYDFPVWRIRAAGGYARVAAEEQDRLQQEQARAALGLLETARAFHPASAELWIERANLELNRLRDPAAAAESYRRAAACPDAPFYAARLHAEILRRLGRKTEALAWLTRLHPALPRGNEAAAADLVLERIRDLEAQLAVPAGQRYPPR